MAPRRAVSRHLRPIPLPKDVLEEMRKVSEERSSSAKVADASGTAAPARDTHTHDDTNRRAAFGGGGRSEEDATNRNHVEAATSESVRASAAGGGEREEGGSHTIERHIVGGNSTRCNTDHRENIQGDDHGRQTEEEVGVDVSDDVEEEEEQEDGEESDNDEEDGGVIMVPRIYGKNVLDATLQAEEASTRLFEGIDALRRIREAYCCHHHQDAGKSHAKGDDGDDDEACLGGSSDSGQQRKRGRRSSPVSSSCDEERGATSPRTGSATSTTHRSWRDATSAIGMAVEKAVGDILEAREHSRYDEEDTVLRAITEAATTLQSSMRSIRDVVSQLDTPQQGSENQGEEEIEEMDSTTSEGAPAPGTSRDRRPSETQSLPHNENCDGENTGSASHPSSSAGGVPSEETPTTATPMACGLRPTVPDREQDLRPTSSARPTHAAEEGQQRRRSPSPTVANNISPVPSPSTRSTVVAAHQHRPDPTATTEDQGRKLLPGSEGHPAGGPPPTKKKIDKNNFSSVEDARWMIKFQRLKQFHNKHGTCDVPSGSDLYEWCTNLRQRHKNTLEGNNQGPRLTTEQMVALNDLNFQWKLPNSSCNNHVGDPPVHNDGPELVSSMPRSLINKESSVSTVSGSLPMMPLPAHEDLPISDSEHDIEDKDGTEEDGDYDWWLMMFAQLEYFRVIKGNCNVPAKYPDNQELADWVVAQRTRGVGGHDPGARVKKLNDLGFCWTAPPPRENPKRKRDEKSKEVNGGDDAADDGAKNATKKTKHSRGDALTTTIPRKVQKLDVHV